MDEACETLYGNEELKNKSDKYKARNIKASDVLGTEFNNKSVLGTSCGLSGYRSFTIKNGTVNGPAIMKKMENAVSLAEYAEGSTSAYLTGTEQSENYPTGYTFMMTPNWVGTWSDTKFPDNPRANLLHPSSHGSTTFSTRMLSMSYSTEDNRTNWTAYVSTLKMTTHSAVNWPTLNRDELYLRKQSPERKQSSELTSIDRNPT